MSRQNRSPQNPGPPRRLPPVENGRSGRVAIAGCILVAATVLGFLGLYEVSKRFDIPGDYDVFGTPRHTPTAVPSKLYPSDTPMGPAPIGTPESSESDSAAGDEQAGCIEQLPTDLKINQKLMLGAHAADMARVATIAERFNIGGVILMDEVPGEAIANFKDQQQVAPLIATDQEGGTVQRFKQPGLLPAAADVPGHPPRDIRKMYSDNYRNLADIGINMNLAPDVDIAPGHNKGVLGNRMYSSRTEKVITFAGTSVEAAQANRMLPTLKHFPGEGTVDGNTDAGPASSAPYSQLKNKDIQPFKALAQSGAAIMIGNQKVPGLTGGRPASVSKDAMAEARKIGTESTVLVTDALDAKAVAAHYDVAEAAVQSMEAGSDIELMVTPGPRQSFRGLMKLIDKKANAAIESGDYSEDQLNESVGRLFGLSQKHVDACELLAKVQE